jgi:hypothetical protein
MTSTQDGSLVLTVRNLAAALPWMIVGGLWARGGLGRARAVALAQPAIRAVGRNAPGVAHPAGT